VIIASPASVIVMSPDCASYNISGLPGALRVPSGQRR
jgi:hypothetical protein